MASDTISIRDVVNGARSAVVSRPASAILLISAFDVESRSDRFTRNVIWFLIFSDVSNGVSRSNIAAFSAMRIPVVNA